jgi:hypothetical protein
LGSCRSTIELRPLANTINHLEIFRVNFVCRFFVKSEPCIASRSYTNHLWHAKSVRLSPVSVWNAGSGAMGRESKCRFPNHEAKSGSRRSLFVPVLSRTASNMAAALLLKDGVIGRPSLWIAEDFWVPRFRLMVKRGPWLAFEAYSARTLRTFAQGANSIFFQFEMGTRLDVKSGRVQAIRLSDRSLAKSRLVLGCRHRPIHEAASSLLPFGRFYPGCLHQRAPTFLSFLTQVG